METVETQKVKTCISANTPVVVEANVSGVCARAEGTIYSGQQSGRGGEEETGAAEAGEGAGASTKPLNVSLLKSFQLLV